MLLQIQPPALTETRGRLYAPNSHVPSGAATSQTDGQSNVSASQRTPESIHGGNSPAKGSSAGWKPVRGEATGSNARQFASLPAKPTFAVIQQSRS